MTAQFRAMKRDVKVVEKTPEPETKAQGDGEVLRVLAENNFDSEKAVEEAEKKGIVKEPTTAVAKLVQQKEVKDEDEVRKERGEPTSTELAAMSTAAKRAEQSAEQGGYTRAGLCVPLHVALKRIQADRMKIAALDADPDKYVGQIDRSYKDMGGVELIDYKIVPGDTLAIISIKLFGYSGRWPELWLLNLDDVNAFDVLYPGRTLKVPKVIPEKHCEPIANAGASQNSGAN